MDLSTYFKAVSDLRPILQDQFLYKMTMLLTLTFFCPSLTDTYTKMKSEFSKPRDRSSCGLIKDALGRQLVAVVGGATGGQGMEFWYPGKFFNVVF